MKIQELFEAATPKPFGKASSIDDAKKLYSKAKGLVTIDAYYDDHPSIDDETIRSYDAIVRIAAKAAGGKLKKGSEVVTYVISGVHADKLPKFFDSIEQSLNLDNWGDAGDEWSLTFDCTNEGLSESKAKKGVHPKHPEATYDHELSDKNVACFTDDDGEQHYVKRKDLPADHPNKEVLAETRALGKGMSKAALAADTEQSDREYIKTKQARKKLSDYPTAWLEAELEKNKGQFDVKFHSRDIKAELAKRKSNKINEAVEVTGEDRYAFANGHRPSGRGTWIFAPKKSIDFSKESDGEDYYQSPHDMLYGEAKRNAKAWAKEHGHTVMYVQT